MNNKIFIISAAIIFAAASEISQAAIENPVGSGRVPPSMEGGNRSGLVRSPNPIDTSSNNVITGNVAGGKYFRGVVPYNATTDFGGRLGSSSMDSFLRYSAGSADSLYNYRGTYEPYYSPQRTVTTTASGGRGQVITAPTAGISNRTVGESALLPLPKGNTSTGRDTTTSSIGYRPMSFTPQEMAKVLSENAGTYPLGGLTAEQYQARMEQVQRDLKEVKDKATELQEKLAGQDNSQLPAAKKEGENQGQPQATERTQTILGQPDKKGITDVYEQMKQDLNGSKELDSGRAGEAKRPLDTGGRETKSGKTETRGELVEPGKSGERDTEKEKSQMEKTAETALLVTRAKTIMGEHKTFASYQQDKFNESIRAAEAYLKQGKYYLAADYYTMASIYKPNDPLAYAGKSHALFLSGEYMSSALYLSRAIEIFPEYVRFRIDLAAMAGDKDKIENRIADVEQWLKLNGAGELQFLLAYIYYQMERPDKAKAAVDSASEKMPDSPAVVTLKKAIYEYMSNR